MLFDDNRFFAIKAGIASLKLHNHKDIFYSEDVNALEAIPDYEALIGIQKIGFDDGSFSTQGTELNFCKIQIDSKETIIEGFYKDTMPSEWLVPYEVRIYIQYEVEEN